MSLSMEQELKATSENFKKIGDPAMLDKIYGKIEAEHDEFLKKTVPRTGDKFPQFRLTDAHGKEVSSADLLAKGPLLVTFYRGGWCPYCNIALQHLQRRLDDVSKRGVTLVAITPEKPDFTLSAAEKNDLKFPVLTDLHNKLSRELGIVYDQSSARELHGKLGVDLNARNGEATWEVPIPATYLVNPEGVIQNAFIEVDFRKRLDPSVAISWIDEMNGSKY